MFVHESTRRVTNEARAGRDGRASGPGSACFVAGTQVLVALAADGSPLTRNIEELQVGDVVPARDQYDAGDDLDPRRITQVFRRTSDHVRVLTIQGDDGNVETIRTTDEHPFYIDGRGWTTAGELAVGDRVQESDGTWQAVLASDREAHADGITVYNFEVEGDHTYFVEDGLGGVDAAWVHNACDFLGENPLRDVPGQLLGRAGSGCVLRRNLKVAGVDAPASAHAHHIVSHTDSRSAAAKDVLLRNGIDINQADNGVYLPMSGKRMSPPTHKHGDTFSTAYHERMTQRITAAEAGGRNGVLDELEAIRQDLLNGTFFD